MRAFRALKPVFQHSLKLNAMKKFNTKANYEPSALDRPSRASILSEPDAFNVEELVSVSTMMEKRMHLGHKVSMLNPYMRPFIYGSRFDQLIFDLDQSREALIRALNFVAHIAYRDGIILFISRNYETAHKVEECAKECKEYAHVRHWDEGLLTNCASAFATEIRLPDCGIFLTTKGSQSAVNEFARVMIPSVAIVDTDSDPRLICYPVPGNDDTAETIGYYCGLFKEAILRGKKRRKSEEEQKRAELEKCISF